MVRESVNFNQRGIQALRGDIVQGHVIAMRRALQRDLPPDGARSDNQYAANMIDFHSQPPSVGGTT